MTEINCIKLFFTPHSHVWPLAVRACVADVSPFTLILLNERHWKEVCACSYLTTAEMLCE